MSHRVKLYGAGKFAIPAAFRQELGLSAGDTMIVELVGEELHVRSADVAVRRAQDKLRKFNPGGVSLTDELIAERRREADGE